MINNANVKNVYLGQNCAPLIRYNNQSELIVCLFKCKCLLMPFEVNFCCMQQIVHSNRDLNYEFCCRKPSISGIGQAHVLVKSSKELFAEELLISSR